MRYDPPGMDDAFKEILFRSRIPPNEAAKYLDVTPRTLKRWIKDNSAPYMARKLLLLKYSNLGTLWPDWDGYRFCGDDLWTPNDEVYSNGEIQAIFWYRQQIRGLKADLREAKQKAEVLTRPSAEIIPFKRG